VQPRVAPMAVTAVAARVSRWVSTPMTPSMVSVSVVKSESPLQAAVGGRAGRGGPPSGRTVASTPKGGRAAYQANGWSQTGLRFRRGVIGKARPETASLSTRHPSPQDSLTATTRPPAKSHSLSSDEGCAGRRPSGWSWVSHEAVDLSGDVTLDAPEALRRVLPWAVRRSM
jgi:hypothetical protein